MNLEPLIFKPRLVEKVWGGYRLEQMILGTSMGPVYGEAWCLSPIPGMESVVDSGECAGLTLSEALKAWNALDSNIPDTFPILIKLLDVNSPLSLQVHPSDTEARLNGDGESGKAEVWYILDAEYARVYHGIKEGVTPEQFEQACSFPKALEAIEYCREIKVTEGDIVPIPPGTVHTAQGLLFAEVQQASDVTYRLFDWCRNWRELHLEKGFRSIRYGEPEALKRDRYASEWFTMERVDASGHIVAEYALEAWLSLTDGTTYLLAARSSIELEGPYLRIYG